MLIGFTIVCLILASVLETLPGAAAQSDIVNGIFQPGSKPYGKTLADWSTAWWQWSVSVPSDKNPLNDKTGKNCQEAQNGPVWFLGGTFGGSADRTCNIPSDRAILFPVYNAECSTAEYPQYKTESDLLKCAKDQIDKVTSMDTSIDGKKITDLQKYRTQSTLFQLTLPKNNVFGTGPGPTNSVSDGFWLLLSPLSPGSHQIHFSNSAVDFTSSAPMNFASAVTYHLNVSK
jgi:hypothetical protein